MLPKSTQSIQIVSNLQEKILTENRQGHFSLTCDLLNMWWREHGLILKLNWFKKAKQQTIERSANQLSQAHRDKPVHIKEIT